MAVEVGLAVAAAGVGAEVLLALRLAGLVEGYHIGPNLEHVRAVGKVHHVRRVASRRAHVHFQAHVVALLAQAGAVAVQLEELQVHEAALDTEGLDGSAAHGSEFGGHGLVGPIAGVQVAMDDLHDGRGEDGVVLEHRFAIGIENGIVAYQKAGDELLYHKAAGVGMGREPGFQLCVALDLEGAAGAHAVVRFGDDRIAGLFGEGFHLGQAFRALDLAGRGNAAQGVVLLHLALVLDGGDVVVLDARGNIEVRAQAGVLLQPVLVVGLNPVYLAPLVGQPGYGTVHLVVVLQVVHLVVVRNAATELLGQIPVVGIGNGQYVHAILFEPGAEMPVGGREMGGNEN